MPGCTRYQRGTHGCGARLQAAGARGAVHDDAAGMNKRRQSAKNEATSTLCRQCRHSFLCGVIKVFGVNDWQTTVGENFAGGFDVCACF